ncbi:MAG: hypothetical protein OXF01_13160 [Gemmatimonadetes bacterium]|nr:hypothetical protein [Gemmatimonadota bacterium]
MSLFLTVTAATQLCAGCTVEFEPTDTLGSTADPAGGGLLAEVLGMGDQGFLMSSDALGPVVIVYDSEGRFQRELTREGDGPGELRGFPELAMGPGGILIHEQFAPSLHLYSSDLEFTRTFRVPGVAGSVQSDPLTGGWLVSYMGAGDGTEAGILLLDQAGEVIRSMPAGEESSSLSVMTGDAIRGADGRIWIASMLGTVEVFDEDLGLLGSLDLELPGLDAWNPATGPAAPPAMVLGMRAAPDGSGVWVFAFAPVIDPTEVRRSQGPRPSVEEMFDTFIYSVRPGPSGLTLVGTDQLDTLVRPLGDGDLAFDMVDTPDGNRVVRVGRLRFSGGIR